MQPLIERRQIVERPGIVHADIMERHSESCMGIDSLQVLKLSTLGAIPDTEPAPERMRVYLLFAAHRVAVFRQPLVNGGPVAGKDSPVTRYLLTLHVGQEPQGQISVEGKYLELATLAPYPDRVVTLHAYVLGLYRVNVHRSQREGFANPQSEVPDGREKELVNLQGFLLHYLAESVVCDVVAIHLFCHVWPAQSLLRIQIGEGISRACQVTPQFTRQS